MGCSPTIKSAKLTWGWNSVGVSIWKWVVFLTFVLVMLVLDLTVFHRKSHKIQFKEAIAWVCFWVGLAALFNVGVYFWYGRESALQFLAGYLIEESLSVDNIFVFILIFTYFGVEDRYQHKVLFWGIIGAQVMRGVMIALGITLIQRVHWIVYFFGAFLVFTGIKMALQKDTEVKPEKNIMVKLFRRFMPVSDVYDGDKFFTFRNGVRMATPLFVVLLVVETTDLVFAVDSIPAVLAVSRDPFIIYTSNIFAILGLRALYFAVSGLMGLFHYLKYGLSLVLVFVGLKMLLSDIYHFPITLALGVIAAILGGSVLLSVWKPKPPPV